MHIEYVTMSYDFIKKQSRQKKYTYCSSCNGHRGAQTEVKYTESIVWLTFHWYLHLMCGHMDVRIRAKRHSPFLNLHSSYICLKSLLWLLILFSKFLADHWGASTVFHQQLVTLKVLRAATEWDFGAPLLSII